MRCNLTKPFSPICYTPSWLVLRVTTMGNIIKAVCECGFESGDIFAGGGFLNFQTIFSAPTICLNCNRFLVKNYMKKYSKCPICRKKVTFYNDPSVQIQINESYKKSYDVFSCYVSDEKGEFRLPDTRYLCPKCGKMTLKFVSFGCWD